MQILSQRQRRETENLLFLMIVTAAGLLLRISLFSFESGDYHQFLHGWFETLQQNGGIRAIGMEIGDYMPPYFYLLSLLTYLPMRDLFSIKLLSAVADVVLACFVCRVVNLRFPDRQYGYLAYALTLFCPTVVLNSAVWAQCDAIFTAALVACLYYCMTGKDWKAMVAFGVAFVFKLQAVFFAPFLAVLVLKRRLRWRTLLAVPAVYLISILPAAIAGRDFLDLLTVYFRQAGQYSMISMFATNLYTWIPTGWSEYLGTPLVIFALTGIFIAVAALYRKRFAMTGEILVSLALFFAMLVPFLLPHMHERYFYLADVLSLVFVFYFPRKLYVPGIMIPASIFAVCHNLFGTEFVQVELVSALVLVDLILVGAHTARLLFASGAAMRAEAETPAPAASMQAAPDRPEADPMQTPAP